MNKLDRLLIGTKKLVYDIQSYEDNSHLSKEIEEVLEHLEALDWGENDHNIDQLRIVNKQNEKIIFHCRQLNY